MKLQQIWIYPIKSLPGISVDQCYAGIRGLEGDRRYMLCDDSSRFISLRQNPNMYSFNVQRVHEGFKISHKDGNDHIILPAYHDSTVRERIVTIWDDAVKSLEMPKYYSDWFSVALGRSCRLVYMPDRSERKINPGWRTGNDLVSFADGYAYLVAGDGSLSEIAAHAGIRNDPRRFRPNLIIENADPRDELVWGAFQVGDVHFEGLKPCERCVVTTIDPDTGEKGAEPLRALSRHKVDNKLVFALHASVSIEGVISVGDEVNVHSRKDYPYQHM